MTLMLVLPGAGVYEPECEGVFVGWVCDGVTAGRGGCEKARLGSHLQQMDLHHLSSSGNSTGSRAASLAEREGAPP